MPMATASSDDAHQILLGKLDLFSKTRTFRNPRWRPSHRRNKNVKQIISEASRKEASMAPTQTNSGSSTPVLSQMRPGDGTMTPHGEDGRVPWPNIAKASQNLSTLVLERNMQASLFSGPSVIYSNIESAPSLHPGHTKPYCDITGLPAPYRDPKTRLRYHNEEIFSLIRSLPQGGAERYLEARGAQVILK